MEPKPPSESEDSRILQAGIELCRQLNLENLSPEKLLWQDQFSPRGRWSQDRQGNPVGRYVTPHFPLFYKHDLVLRPVMQERLASEEWKPLLASSLIFYGQLRSQVSRRAALLFAPMLALSAILLPGLLIRNSIFNDLSVVLTFTALIIATGIVGAYSSLLQSRKFMLLADREAAEQFGPQALLSVLQKIQSFKQSDKQEDKMAEWAWTEYGDAPSIEKRISNLQKPPIS
jgi:hypothetical protein